MAEEPFKTQWTFYPEWIEGMDAKAILECALKKMPAIAQKKNAQICEPQIDKEELSAILGCMVENPDSRIREEMLKNYCPGNVEEMIWLEKNEQKIKDFMYRFIICFDYQYYMARILVEQFWYKVCGFKGGQLSPTDYVELYNRAIISALEETVNLCIDEVEERTISLYLRGNLGIHNGKVMLELFEEIAGLIFPEVDKYRKACLAANMIFSRARQEIHTQQTKKSIAAISAEDKAEALMLLTKMQEAYAASKKVEETT